MRMHELNEWMVLNNIIYKIYTAPDDKSMRYQLLEQLKMVIDFDAADFYIAATGREGLENPVYFNCENTECAEFDELDYSRGIMYGGKTMIYRETDIVSDEARMKTAYYQKIYKPNNWHYSLQIILYHEHEFMGVITLYRTIGKDNFEYDDIFIMDMLKNHIAFRMFSDKQKKLSAPNKITVDDAEKKYELTKREKTVLELMLAGLDNQEIADKLVISVHTLKKHVLNIYRKLGVNNRLALVRKLV